MSEKLNVKRVILDAEKLGMPEVFLYHHGVSITAQIENIETDEFDVILTTGTMKLRLTHLSNNIKTISRPANLIQKCKLSYAICDDYNEHVLDLYWSE